jgi:hypothetical protein
VKLTNAITINSGQSELNRILTDQWFGHEISEEDERIKQMEFELLKKNVI